MAGRTSPTTTDVPVGDENAAAAAPVDLHETVPTPDPTAAESGGEKLIRCRHRDTLRDSDGKVRVDSTWRKFKATEAKELLELAERNNVRLLVANVETKG